MTHPQPNLCPKIVADLAEMSPDQQHYYLFKKDQNLGFRVHGLAVEVCKRMKGGETLSEIVETVADQYRLSAVDLEQDVAQLVQNMEAHQLLQWQEKASR